MADTTAIEILVLAQVRRLICEMNECELLEYRRLVRKECGYTDEKPTIQ
jgi:uncharacterized protein YpbB